MGYLELQNLYRFAGRFLVTLALLPTLLPWLSKDEKVILVPNLYKLRLKETKDKNKALEKQKRILYISKVSGFSCVVVQRNVHVGNAAILREEASKVFGSNKRIQVANWKKSEQKLNKNALTGLTLSREVSFSRKVSSSLVSNTTTLSLLPGERKPRYKTYYGMLNALVSAFFPFIGVPVNNIS